MWLAAVVLVFNGALPVQGAPAPLPIESKLTVSLQTRLAGLPAGEMLPVIVNMHGALDPKMAARVGKGATRQERLIRGLSDRAKASQANIRSFLAQKSQAGQVGEVVPFWITNSLSVEASPELIQLLAARSDVARIEPVETFQAPALTPAGEPGWDNRGMINAPQLWALGIRGQGVVVANLDSGVDSTHPELQDSWRGGSNSWFDPYGRHATPTDLPAGCGLASGHGTGTMGVMVGNTVGVAPDAQWIAAKIFDDNCQADTTHVLMGLQWVVNPDGDLETEDAPQVVNSSWGGVGCNLTYQGALQALRAAGILPVFSAGNEGPRTITYPANNPEAFPVGATDQNDLVASFSSRGPNQCVQPEMISPALVAPGVNILTSGLGGGLVTANGTSFAAPHVAGALALLISAFQQGVPLAQQEQALTSSAVRLGGPASPNNHYGYGRLDVWAAYQSLPKLSFSQFLRNVSEDGGPLLVDLQINPASDQPVTVFLAANGGDGLGNEFDYTLPVHGTFPPGKTEITIQVEIIDDALPEADETFQIKLVDPGNAILASDLTITILDNDIQVGFAQGGLTVKERDGSAALNVTRRGGLTHPVTVDFSVSGGTATAGVNYQVDPAPLIFAPGVTQQSIMIQMLTNHQPAPDQSLILDLLSSPDVSIDPAASQTTLTILDEAWWIVRLPVILR